jgi:hypothetical protein
LGGNARGGSSEGGEDLMQGGDMLRPTGGGGLDSGDRVEVTDFLVHSGGRLNSTVGLGEFMNEPVDLEEDTSMRTSNFHFRGNFGMGLAVRGVAAEMSRGAFGMSDDVGLSAMYGGNCTGDWGNIARVDSGMPVDSEGRVHGVNVNLALNGRHM